MPLRCSAARLAEPLDGPWADGVRRIARSAGVIVVAGMFVPADETAGRHQHADRDRAPASTPTTTRSTSTTRSASPSRTPSRPASEPVVITVDGVRVGLTLCYDVRFPELYVELARRGAQLITVHASWGTGAGKLEQWTLLARARAMDTASFVAAVGQAYPGDEIAALGPTGVGGSVVASPLGEVIDIGGRRPAAARHRHRPRCRADGARTDRGDAQPHRSTLAIRQNRGGD